jgi:hypothetical protein
MKYTVYSMLDARRYSSVGIAVFLFCLVSLFSARADQVIYVRVADFDTALSAFDKDVAGNRWVETEEEGALFGTAYGAPGDNNRDTEGPHIVIKLPVPVKPGESTQDGKTWIAWARMYEPGSLKTGNLNNSMFFRMSPDAKNWTPQNRGGDLLWNDPGGSKNNLLFPDSINGVDSIFTDLGDELPWFWQNHMATVDAPRGPDSSMDPPLEVGDNYVELVPRESDPADYPRIEIICFRNDGQQPSDGEAIQFIQNLMPVEPMGKLGTCWSDIKVGH